MLHCHKLGVENLPTYSFNVHKLAEIQVVDCRDKPEISSCGGAGQIIIIFVQWKMGCGVFVMKKRARGNLRHATHHYCALCCIIEYRMILCSMIEYGMIKYGRASLGLASGLASGLVFDDVKLHPSHANLIVQPQKCFLSSPTSWMERPLCLSLINIYWMMNSCKILIVICVGCSVLNWDLSCTGWGASSFVGLDSSGETWFAFLLVIFLFIIGVLVIEGCEDDVCHDRIPTWECGPPSFIQPKYTW